MNSVVTRLTASEARTAVPVLRQDYISAAIAERHAYDLDVHALHQSYLMGIKANGGQVLCGHRLTAAEHGPDGWHVAAGSELIRCTILVNAAGAWGDQVAEMSGVKPIGLIPKRRTAALVAAPDLDVTHWPAVVDIGEKFYFKPEAGRILLSPADETPSEPCDAYADDLDVAVAVDRVQQAADIPVNRLLASWAGLRTFTSDKTPVVGFDTRVPSFFWLVGQGGYGIQTAPALAQIAAALVLNRSIPAEIVDAGVEFAHISPGRPQLEQLLPGAGERLT